MQKTTPAPQSEAVLKTPRSSQRAIKSFTDLSGAIIDKDIDQFALLVRQGIDTWRTAGQLLVETCKRQPDIFRMIVARHPHISMSTLQTFAAIGRGEIWPPLLADSSMGARKLLECNYDLQKEYSEKPLKLAVSWKNGEIKTVEKKVSDLSRSEVAIVFDGAGGINNLDAQAWRLRTPAERVLAKPELITTPNMPPPAYAPPRLVNNEVGHFDIELQEDGTVTCSPCDKFANSQSVRLFSIGKRLKTKIVLYKQVSQ